MNLNRARLSLLLLFPLSVAAQETPKLELFGGFSYLKLTEQPRILLEPAGLSGWQASLKLNVTPRIGLLADFSGSYGERGLTPFTTYNPSASMRQHTFLLGPEARLFRRGRLTMNARALMGVAHTNTLGIPYREQPGGSTFAAAFGGSADFHITERLSYRIVQPELLLTRSGSPYTGNWNQYNFRLSTGVVFNSGESAGYPSSAGQVSFGVIGGAAVTDAFRHESTGLISLPGGGLEPVRSRSYSTLKDYIIGPVLEIGLPWRNLSLEVDALYRPMNLTMAGVRPDGSLHSISPATVVTWQFPALAKYRFGSHALKPFLQAGPSFRVAGNLNGAAPSAYGGAAGFGVEAQFRKLRIGPVVRYTHWAADAGFTASRTRRNQAELLVALSF